MEVPSDGGSPLAVSTADEAAQIILLTGSVGATGSDSGPMAESQILSAAEGQAEKINDTAPHVKTHSRTTNTIVIDSKPSKRHSTAPRVPQISFPDQHTSDYARTQIMIDRVKLKAQHDRKSLACYTIRNIIYFAILFSVLLCLCTAISVYMDGVMHDLQKVYFLANSQVHFLEGVGLIGVVVTLFMVALFGRSAHKPLLIFCGVVICSCGSFICAVPYFIDNASDNAVRIDDAQSFRNNSAFTTAEQLPFTANTASSQRNLFLPTELTVETWYNANQYTDSEAVFHPTSAGIYN
jgi:hypothetical protein